MGMVYKNGMIILDTKAIGETDKQKGKVNFTIQMEIFIKETFIEIDPMVMENIYR